MRPRSVSQWSLRLLFLPLLLPVSGCGGHSGPISVKVENRYSAVVEVYRTGLNSSGSRETVLLGNVEAKGIATFPKAFPPGEKVYHLKFKQRDKAQGDDVVITGESLRRKLGPGDTWTVTAGQ
jgi:hypothetical protein